MFNGRWFSFSNGLLVFYRRKIKHGSEIKLNKTTAHQEEAADFQAEFQAGGEGRETFALSGTTPELDQLVLCFSDRYQEWFRARVTSVTGLWHLSYSAVCLALYHVL